MERVQAKLAGGGGVDIMVLDDRYLIINSRVMSCQWPMDVGIELSPRPAGFKLAIHGGEDGGYQSFYLQKHSYGEVYAFFRSNGFKLPGAPAHYQCPFCFNFAASYVISDEEGDRYECGKCSREWKITGASQ